MTLRPDRLALFAAVLVVLIGYLAVFRPSEAAIAERYARLDDARERLDQRLALERRAGDARAHGAALAAWIRDAGLHDARPTIVARFLRRLDRRARADGVAISGVSAEPEARPNAVAVPAVVFDELPLRITARGSYANVLRLVRDLGDGTVAARVAIVALGNADRRAPGAPALHATFDVTLVRLPDDAPKAVRAAG